jgi:hypothetical protein
MAYSGLVEAYRDFLGIYIRPACCGLLHWGPQDLDQWLRLNTPWDGDWKHLSPALVIRASRAALEVPCPKSHRQHAKA